MSDNKLVYSSKKEFFAHFKKNSNAVELWLRFIKNKTAVVGLVVFTLIVLVALFAPLIADYNDVAIDFLHNSE